LISTGSNFTSALEQRNQTGILNLRGNEAMLSSARRKTCYKKFWLFSIPLVSLGSYMTHSHDFVIAGLQSTDMPTGVSIVAGCRLYPQREENFLKSFESWTKVVGVKEIVLVDWQSTTPLDSMVSGVFPTKSDLRITLVVLNSTTVVPWRIGASFNLGLMYANHPLILKLDCDTFLHEDFLLLNDIDQTSFRYGDWRHARPDGNDGHLNGVFFARAQDLFAIHGFDERLAVYGWDDSDLYLRLEETVRKNSNFSEPYKDFKREVMEDSLISHLPHERSDDATFEMVGICFNYEATRQLPKWEGQQTHKYDCAEEDSDKQQHNLHSFVCDVSAVPETAQHVLGFENCKSIATLCAEHHGKPEHVDKICRSGTTL